MPTSNRFPAAREKQFSRKRKTYMCWTPFFFFMPDRTGTSNILFDGDGHHCSWRWTHVAHQPAVVVWWHVQKVIVRNDLTGEAKDSGWPQTRFFPRNGTNDQEQSRCVPFCPTRLNRVKTRPEREEGCRRRTIVCAHDSGRRLEELKLCGESKTPPQITRL